MDSKLWRKFPEDLLPIVLARLPWWKNLELRGVCKSWHRLLSNPDFLAKSFPVSTSQPPYIIMATREKIAIVNFAIRRGNVLPLSSILPGFRGEDCWRITAAMSGIILMDPGYGSRYLVNPLNKTQRLLPPVPPVEGQNLELKWRQRLTVMANEKANNVKIVCSETPDDYFYMRDYEICNIYVYDLVKNSWDLVCKNPQLRRKHALWDAVFVGEELYLLTLSVSYTWSVLRATATDLVEVPAEFTAGFPNVNIFQHRGHLMVMRGKQECVDIWVLEDMRTRWEKVVSMPKPLLTKFNKFSVYRMKFHVEEDFVSIASFTETEFRVVYNLVDQVWWEISCKDFMSLDFFHHVRTFLWQPNLNIVL